MILDYSFLERMRQRDPETLEYWENEIVRPSYGYSMMCLGFEQDAMDVCQETQRVMIEKIKCNRARHIISPRAYALVITRRECYKILKYRARVSEVLPSYWEYGRSLLGQHYEEIMTMPTGKLLELVDKLTSRQRQVVYLSFIEGISYSQIAEIMKIKQSTVRGHILKALKALRKMIESIEKQDFISNL